MWVDQNKNITSQQKGYKYGSNQVLCKHKNLLFTSKTGANPKPRLAYESWLWIYYTSLRENWQEKSIYDLKMGIYDRKCKHRDFCFIINLLRKNWITGLGGKESCIKN